MEKVKSYFRVVAKCGHVGRKSFLLKSFYIMAADGKAAAEIARGIPRVKHHHKDAIWSVDKICRAEYRAGIRVNNNDPFFKFSNVQQQRAFLNGSGGCVVEETPKAEYRRYCKDDRSRKQAINRKLERKRGKYAGRCA